MKRTRSQVEKWAAGVLSVVCLALLMLLLKSIFSSDVLRVKAAQPTLSRIRSANADRPRAAGPAARDELAHYDPELNLDLLMQIESQPLPQTSRNPFEFPPTVRKPAQAAGGEGPAPPPPPPPLPLKAIGYSVKTGGVPEAVITDDQDIYVVHVGEIFAKRFRVMSLTPSRVEIEDASTQQVVQLPIAP